MDHRAIALTLAALWVPGACGSRHLDVKDLLAKTTLVYGDKCPAEWSLLFHLLNTDIRKGLPLAHEDPRFPELERRILLEKRGLALEDFASTPIDVPFYGEREWSPLHTGVPHLFREPVYSRILEAVEELVRTAESWRATVDPLPLARFQNDIVLALRALEHFARFDATLTFAEAPQKRLELQTVLNDLLDIVLLSKEEISLLPDTGDLGTSADDERLFGDQDLSRIALCWRDQPTIHESASFDCIRNEIYVVYPRRQEDSFARKSIETYVANQEGCNQDCKYYLIDRLVVLDKERQPTTSKVTVMVRVEDFRRGKPTAHSFNDVFSIYFLRRGARTTEWLRHIERAEHNEHGGALVDLPNIGGYLRPYYKVPLGLSCIGCHGDKPMVFRLYPGDALNANPRNLLAEVLR